MGSSSIRAARARVLIAISKLQCHCPIIDDQLRSVGVSSRASCVGIEVAVIMNKYQELMSVGRLTMAQSINQKWDCRIHHQQSMQSLSNQSRQMVRQPARAA